MTELTQGKENVPVKWRNSPTVGQGRLIVDSNDWGGLHKARGIEIAS